MTQEVLQAVEQERQDRKKPFLAEGYALNERDVLKIKSLAEIVGCSESAILRGILARAWEIEITEENREEQK